MNLEKIASRYLPAIEAEMRAAIASPSPELEELYGYLQYSLGWVDTQFRPKRRSGKRLRPVLCLLTYEACGREDWERALPAAAAVELAHNFSLIHDDIEDRDTTRRGSPSLWALWGIPQAINAGDALYALSYLALIRLSDRGVPPQTVNDILRIFAQTCLRLTEGQFLDMRFETGEVSLPAYMEMIGAKTGTLLSASCELGALIADSPTPRVEHLRAFGLHLGLAFQIQDDILGLWGDPQVTGKPVGSDLRRRKKTLPILHCLEQSREFQALVAREDLSSQDVERAMELLESTQSRDWAEERAEEETGLALAALSAAGIQGPAADALFGLTQTLLRRAR